MFRTVERTFTTAERTFRSAEYNSTIGFTRKLNIDLQFCGR